MKFICEECGVDIPCVSEVPTWWGFSKPFTPFECLYGLGDAVWKVSDSKRLGSKDKFKNKFKFCVACTNNDETCSFCNSCDDGSKFEPKKSSSAARSRLARSRFWKRKEKERVRRKWKSFESQQMRFIQDRMFKRKDDPQTENQAEDQTAKAAKAPKAKLTPEQYKGWLLGNLLKYSCRANHKGQFSRDIEKACIYGIELFDSLGVKEEQDA